MSHTDNYASLINKHNPEAEEILYFPLVLKPNLGLSGTFWVVLYHPFLQLCSSIKPLWKYIQLCFKSIGVSERNFLFILHSIMVIWKLVLNFSGLVVRNLLIVSPGIPAWTRASYTGCGAAAQPLTRPSISFCCCIINATFTAPNLLWLWNRAWKHGEVSAVRWEDTRGQLWAKRSHQVSTVGSKVAQSFRNIYNEVAAAWSPFYVLIVAHKTSLVKSLSLLWL